MKTIFLKTKPKNWLILLVLPLIFATACSKDDPEATPEVINNENGNGNDDENGETGNVTATADIHFFATDQNIDFQGLNNIDFDRQYGAITFDLDNTGLIDEMHLEFMDQNEDFIQLSLDINDDDGIDLDPYSMDQNVPERYVKATISNSDFIYMALGLDVNQDGTDISGTATVQFTSITDTHVKGTFSFVAYTQFGPDDEAKKVEVINGEFDTDLFVQE